ncbi:MAG: KH domain-containing protein [Actinomycetota bacterium]|nr:KH domain-containing protein [Actinomycetota bacterium]
MIEQETPPEGEVAEPGESEVVETEPAAVTAADATDERESEVGEEEPASLEDVATTASEFTSGLLKAMQLEAEVEAKPDGRRVVLDVTGSGLGVLIGRRGQTLDALQELIRTAVQRRLKARVRLLVDVEGYRARRRASLADYARAMAVRAKERGTEIELEPMNSFERKIVHDAVSEVDGATSFSEGDEPDRKVIVRGE